MTKIRLELCRGLAGDALYLADYRIAGPRHNGVMRTIQSWELRPEDVREALAQFDATECDSDGAATAAANGDLPVPQDHQARREAIARKDHP